MFVVRRDGFGSRYQGAGDSRTNSSAKGLGKTPPLSWNIGIKSTTFLISSPSFASCIIVNQVRERILGCVCDGEGPTRGWMNPMCLLSNADRFKGSDRVGTRRLVLLEPSIGEVVVEEPLVAVVASSWTTVLSTGGSAKRSCSEAVSSPKRSSISTLAFFL